jgi:hypothetical protein
MTYWRKVDAIGMAFDYLRDSDLFGDFEMQRLD